MRIVTVMVTIAIFSIEFLIKRLITFTPILIYLGNHLQYVCTKQEKSDNVAMKSRPKMHLTYPTDRQVVINIVNLLPSGTPIEDCNLLYDT